MRSVGDINQRRIAERAAHYAVPAVAARLAQKKNNLLSGSMHRLVQLFSNLDNPLIPAIVEDALCFAAVKTEQEQHEYGFLTDKEELAYSLLQVDGSLNTHVQHGPYANVPHQGNNLIVRIVEQNGQKEMRGLVFPERFTNEQGFEQRRSHTQAYSERYGAFWFAGEIAANSFGQITYLSNKSGHNLTGDLELAALVQYFYAQGRLDIANLTVAVMTKEMGKLVLQGANAIEFTRSALSLFSSNLAAIGVENLENKYQEFKNIDFKHASEEELASLSRPKIKNFQQQRMQAYEHWQSALAARRLLMNIGFDPVTGSIDLNRSLPLRPYR